MNDAQRARDKPRATVPGERKRIAERAQLELIQSQIEASRITPDQIAEWFESALDSDDPKPSRGAYEQLAAHVARLREAPWPYASQEELHRRRDRVMRAAGELRACLEEWANLSPEELQTQPGPARSMRELIDLLDALGVSRFRPPAQKPQRGRRRHPGTKYRREIAELVRNILQQAGYGGTLSLTSETSPAVVITQSLVNEIFPLRLSEGGVATALRRRDRRKSVPQFDPLACADGHVSAAPEMWLVPIRPIKDFAGG